jgi:hypothetical protein
MEEEKAMLEGKVKSRNELITEIARETKHDRMGDDAKDEEDANDGSGAAPPPIPMPPAAAPEEINDEGHVEMVPEQEAHVVHKVLLADAELEI